MGSLKYTTLQGDTFDILALDFYNDPFLAHKIMEANPDYADVIIFDAGIELTIPVLDTTESTDSLPPWRR